MLSTADRPERNSVLVISRQIAVEAVGDDREQRRVEFCRPSVRDILCSCSVAPLVCFLALRAFRELS